MEIQSGKGPWAPPVSGIVPIGSTLTLVVAINDYRGKIGLLYLFGYLLQKKNQNNTHKLLRVYSTLDKWTQSKAESIVIEVVFVDTIRQYLYYES